MTTVRGVTSSSGFVRSTLCTCGQTGTLHRDDEDEEKEDGDDDDDDDDEEEEEEEEEEENDNCQRRHHLLRLRQVHLVHLWTDKNTSPG